jgi:F-type H+-transporting ATPase subunit c
MIKKSLVSLAMFAACFAPMLAFAADPKAAANPAGWAIALASGLAIAIAVLGGALGQGRAAAAAFEGIARNPESQRSLFLVFVLGLALIESLVIFAFVIANGLLGKL